MPRVRNISTMAELNAALMAAFNAINKEFYKGELEKPIITVKEGKRKSAYGWIEVSKNWKQSGTERHEINISVDYIGERSVSDTITTLMHEMVHLYCLNKGIKDTSRGNAYHNNKFKEIAEKHGLVCEYNEHIGWSHTTATPATRQWITDNINIKSINVYKQTSEKKGGGGKSKQSMRKLVCPECGNIVRVTKDINVICGECTTEDTGYIYFVEET